MGLNVRLTNETPHRYIKKIANIPFADVVDGFKYCCITLPDLETFVIDKFHDVDIIEISVPKEGMEFTVLIEVAENTDDAQIDEMKNYLLDVDIGTDSIVIKKTSRIKQVDDDKNAGNKHPLFGMLNVAQLGIDKSLEFTVTESERWFENAEKIYTGNYSKREIPSYNDGLIKCLVDCSMFENLNLRNLLLLFDVVYVLPPLIDSFDDFLAKQKISDNELLELTNLGKMVLLLTNRESRYCKNLMHEAYRNNKLSIIGRRGANTLVASHIIETKQRYIRHFPNVYEISSEIFNYGIKEKSENLQQYAKLLAWPITTSIDSFRMLNMYGPLGYGDFGFGDVILPSSKLCDSQKENLSLYLMYENPIVLIASALNAIYFPAFRMHNGIIKSNAVLGNLFGDFLKAYWHDASTLSALSDVSEQSRRENHMLSFFECKENIAITKVAKMADEYKTHNTFRDILVRLDSLCEKDRNAKIRQYNDILFDLSFTKAPSSKIDFALSASAFLPVNYPISFLLSATGIAKWKFSSSSGVEKRKELKFIEKCLSNMDIQIDKSLVEDVYILDKISRVAHLK